MPSCEEKKAVFPAVINLWGIIVIIRRPVRFLLSFSEGYKTLIPIPIGSHYKTDNFQSIFLTFPTYQFFRTWYHFKDGSVLFQ